TAVQLRHGANDRQAEAGAAVAVPGGGEALEEAIADCGIDARTVIAHLGDALRTAADLQLDALSLRRVLDGIADEVLERPAQPEGIAADPERPAGAPRGRGARARAPGALRRPRAAPRGSAARWARQPRHRSESPAPRRRRRT